MRKNLLAVATMAVVVFFVSTEMAKAADVSFSGQVRTRWDAMEQFTNIGTNETDDAVFSSVRLGAKANVNETTSAFIQFQSTRNWGELGTGTEASGGGSGNASNTVNDNDESVGVHQAYMQFKNFLGLPFDAKIGRQEVLLDGWRLFGNTIWTPGMQSHDMVRLDHKQGNMHLMLGYILHQEGGRSGDANDGDDIDNWVGYLNVKGVLGGQFSGYWNYRDEQQGNLGQAVQYHTIGGRQAGNMAGLDYRVEAYFQFGPDAGGVNNPIVSNNVDDAGATRNFDYDFAAHMFGVRLGKTFKNVSFKPGITMWYDYLSGTSDDQGRDGTWGSFWTLYDTGHKYYGLIDMFLGVGSGNATSGVSGLGLQDMAIKLKMKPMAGWTLKTDYHWFWTAESIVANPTTSRISRGTTVNTDMGNFLGNELDITAVTKMNPNTKVMIGYSNYSISEGFRALKSGANIGSEDANWGYVQFDVQF